MSKFLDEVKQLILEKQEHERQIELEDNLETLLGKQAIKEAKDDVEEVMMTFLETFDTFTQDERMEQCDVAFGMILAAGQVMGEAIIDAGLPQDDTESVLKPLIEAFVLAVYHTLEEHRAKEKEEAKQAETEQAANDMAAYALLVARELNAKKHSVPKKLPLCTSCGDNHE